MALPPERISVKRQRQEEPVEALYLQEGPSHNQKRRFTDYYFKLLRDDGIAPRSTKPRHSLNPQVLSSRGRGVDSEGVPVVRATKPGEEVEDLKILKAAQQARLHENTEPSVEGPGSISPQTSPSLLPSATRSPQPKPVQPPRRFHLTRTLSSFYRPDTSGGIRKVAAPRFRPPLPTFVERQDATQKGAASRSNLPPITPTNVQHAKGSVPEREVSNQPVSSLESPFDTAKGSDPSTRQELPSVQKDESSIQDDPSTWNTNSDQLADELAALAMELEPVYVESPKKLDTSHLRPLALSQPDVVMHEEEDFILETYVRVYRNDMVERAETSPDALNNFGMLVIDEEDEDLWQAYMTGEEEDERDEEDSNAEDNPDNDYPEDEVSSEDEFNRGAYRHRMNDSDHEQYDDDSDGFE